MKRFFILASAAIVALASCAKTEVVYKDGPQEIAFKQVTNVMTKADPEALVGDMGVYAYTSTDPTLYFGPVKFIQNGTYWTGDPAQYYPLQTGLDFACYSPYDAAWGYNNTTQTLTSPLFEDVKSVDILFGEKIYADCGTTDAAVTVLFKHALAKVTVNILSNYPAQIVINTITLNGVNTKGKLTVDYESDALASVLWSDTVPEDYEWTKATDFNLSETSQAFGDPIFFIAGYTDFYCQQTSFDVSYTMNGVTMNAHVDLSTNTDGSYNYWEMGKHYTYTLKADLNEIKLDPKVEVMDIVDRTPAPAL